MTRERVLVVYTGGTIGMVETPAGWSPGADLAGWLRGLVARELPGVRVDLVALEPLVDSSSARPRDWQRMADAIEAGRADHDAFVVLHGTDTLAYSAAALDFALGATPVVLTGSQRSLVAPGSDAAGNVLGALRAAVDPRLAQVALFFDGQLFAGSAVTKVSSVADHAFDSPNRAPLALCVGDGAVVPDQPERRPAPFADVDLVVVSLHPGLRPRRLAALLSPAPQAVVLRAYGAGNAPDDDPELLDALRRAHEAGTVIVVTTQCGHGGVHLGQYAVSQGLLGVGAVSGGDLPVEALVARLTGLLSQGLGPDEVRASFGTSAG